MRAKAIFGLVKFPALLSHTGLYCENEVLLWSGPPPLAVVQKLGEQKLLLPLVHVLLQLHHLLLLVPLGVAPVARANSVLQSGPRSSLYWGLKQKDLVAAPGDAPLAS